MQKKGVAEIVRSVWNLRQRKLNLDDNNETGQILRFGRDSDCLEHRHLMRFGGSGAWEVEGSDTDSEWLEWDKGEPSGP